MVAGAGSGSVPCRHSINPLATGILAIVIGYLFGSIPSAYLIGRIKGVDMREVGNGRIGASFAVRRLGLASGLIVGFMDLGKGVMAVVCAQLLNVHLAFVLLAGLAAVTGHNWSIVLGFKGGRGALTSYGVLASLIPWLFLIALALAGVLYSLIWRTTLVTVMMFVILTIFLWTESRLGILSRLPWTQGISPLLIAFPPFLLIPMLLKHPRKWTEQRRLES